jgi:hypothetical protein
MSPRDRVLRQLHEGDFGNPTSRAYPCLPDVEVPSPLVGIVTPPTN